MSWFLQIISCQNEKSEEDMKGRKECYKCEKGDEVLEMDVIKNIVYICEIDKYKPFYNTFLIKIELHHISPFFKYIRFI